TGRPGPASTWPAFGAGRPARHARRHGSPSCGILRSPSAARKESAVTNTVDALVLDLLEWIGPRPRPYAEVIDAWRTSCPRLTVWEDANSLGYVTHERSEQGGALVSVSPRGRAALSEHRHVGWTAP